jgi:hypothetical protein
MKSQLTIVSIGRNEACFVSELSVFLHRFYAVGVQAIVENIQPDKRDHGLLNACGWTA